MAEPRKNYSDINERLISTVFSDDFELKSFGAGNLYKAEKNTSKDDKEVNKKPQKPAKTAFKQWARNWMPGDSLPILPPGKILQLDSFGLKPNKKPLFRDKESERKRSLNEIGLMSSKSVLGRTINNMPGAMQIIAMVAKRRGIPVDDQGKLRCPAGTPAANQFTDLQMSNCMVPSAATIAGDAADVARRAVGNATARAGTIGGAVSIGDREPDGAGNPVYGDKEAAARFLIFKKRRSAREKLVAKLYGNVRSNSNARKALLRAFPKMDKESLDRFLNDFGGLSGQDLADYIDMREGFISSLLYEASKNREAAEASEIVWQFGEELLSIGEGFQVVVDTAEDAMPFVAFRYSPIGLVNVKNNIEEKHLSNGVSNDVDNPQNASDFGSYVGTHEFFHLADFHSTFKKFGLEMGDTSYDEALQNIEDVANGDVDGALNQGLITPEQHALWNLHQKLESDIASGIASEDAVDAFYTDLNRFFTEGTGLYTPEVAHIMKDVVGSTYGHQSNIENRAELGAAASYFPELLQQRIDEINSDRIINGLRPIPDLDDLMKDVFGTDVTTPPTQNTQIPRPGVRRRTVRAARAASKPGGSPGNPEDISDITDDTVDEYLDSTFDNLRQSINRRRQSRRKNVNDMIFQVYSSEEIEKILASIPVSQRGNNRYIQTLLTVPQRLEDKRTPSGAKSPAEDRWLDLLSEAIQNDWIDFVAISDTYALRGEGSKLETVKASARALRRSVQQRREERQLGNTAKATTRKLTGSMGNPRVSKISGSMAWVSSGPYVGRWVDDPKPPKVENRVPVSISPVGTSGKMMLQWGDDSWEIDTNVNPDDIWNNEAFKEWSTFHGNYAMRYVSAMLMGQDIPISEGYRDETLDGGLESIHDELVSGTTSGIEKAKQARVRKEIENTVAALRTIVSSENAKPYEIFRGLTGVPDEASILRVKKGETIELPLSAFTPSEDWAYEMGEFTEDGQGVIIKVLPGARSTPAEDEYVENPTKRFDNYFEVVTAGRFEVVEVDDKEDEQTVITLKQTEVFDPITSQYFPVKDENKPGKKIAGSISSGNKIGTTTKYPVATLTSSEINTADTKIVGGDYSRSKDIKATRSMPVYSIGDEKIAFGTRSLGVTTPEYSDKDVKIVPLNPYEISGKAKDSKEGHEAALLWFYATIKQNEEDTANAAYPSALLYAASRGDSDAQNELERLAEAGRKATEEQKEEYIKWASSFKESSRNPGEFDWGFEYPELLVDIGQYSSETGRPEQRVMGLDDLFMVHQTSYKPQVDSDGNVILRPAEDYDFIDPETNEIAINPENGMPYVNHRGTIHLSLNHLVQGHMYRPTPTGKTYAVIIPARTMIEDNPGALDNLYAIDTYMTPKPGEGLKLSRDAVRIVELPSLSDYDVDMPEGNSFDWTEEQKKTINEAVEKMNADAQRMITQMLQVSGAAHNDSQEYKTRVIPGGMHGSKDSYDRRIRELALELGVPSLKHDSTPHAHIEGITAMVPDEQRQISIIHNSGWSPMWTMSENAILRLADGDRFSSAETIIQRPKNEGPWI